MRKCWRADCQRPHHDEGPHWITAEDNEVIGLPDTGLDVERLARAMDAYGYNAGLRDGQGVAAEYARLTEGESRSNISNPTHSDWHEEGPACEPLIHHVHRKADRIIVWSHQ